MATLFGSPPFLSHPLSRTHFSASSSQPPTPPPQQPQPPPPLTAQSTTTPLPLKQQKTTTTPLPLKQQKTTPESTDWIASSLTRRFGLGAGLAWAGFLAVGVLSEQVKTRLEVSQQDANTKDVDKEEEVILPNGIRYTDLRVGGGASARAGDLAVIDLKGRIAGDGNGGVFVDTFDGEKKRPLALVVGRRPYSRGMCQGIEYILTSMKAGGIRKVIIPPNLGFGEKGADFGTHIHIPPFATLEYIIELEKVSIAPA